MEIVFVQMLMIGFSVDVPVCICTYVSLSASGSSLSEA